MQRLRWRIMRLKMLTDHQADIMLKTPFFHYVAFTAPHFPLQALPEDIARVGDRYKPGWDVIRGQRWERLQEMGSGEGSALTGRVRDLGPPLRFPRSTQNTWRWRSQPSGSLGYAHGTSRNNFNRIR